MGDVNRIPLILLSCGAASPGVANRTTIDPVGLQAGAGQAHLLNCRIAAGAGLKGRLPDGRRQEGRKSESGPSLPADLHLASGIGGMKSSRFRLVVSTLGLALLGAVLARGQ